MHNVLSVINQLKEQIALAEQVVSKLEKQNSLQIELGSKLIRGYYTWDEANQFCEFLGNGWRLPTINELKKIREVYHNLEDECYWATLNENSESVMIVNMADGKSQLCEPYRGLVRFRPVRNLVR